MSIFILLLSFLPLATMSLSSPSIHNVQHEHDVSVFLRQIQMDADHALQLRRRNSANVLSIEHSDGREIRYFLTGDRIIRTVDGRGYEIALERVSDFIVSNTSYGVHVTIFTNNGTSYERKYQTLFHRVEVDGGWVSGDL